MLSTVPELTPAVLRRVAGEFGLSEAVVADIYAKLRYGARVVDIATIYNIPYRKAYMIARSLGFKFKQRTKITHELEQQVVELRKQGLTYEQIMKELGICRNTVWQILKKHGLIGRIVEHESKRKSKEIVIDIPEDGEEGDLKDQGSQGHGIEVTSQQGQGRLLIEIEGKDYRIRIILLNEANK